VEEDGKVTSLSYKVGFRDGFFSWPQKWYHHPMLKDVAEKVNLLPVRESSLPDWDDYKRGFTQGAFAAWRLGEKIKENENEVVDT
jgi:hypothetical protein